jgi:hypothetical protein
MASMFQLKGVPKMRAKLRRAGGIVAQDMRRGLIKGGLLLQRLSQEVVPIDTTNLQGSAGTRAFGQGFNTDVIVYYTASYAVYVHERTDLQHAPGKQAKFLEGPARKNSAQLLRTIESEAGRR